jgi:3-deoxy-7-phosphoheptulonate synthase
MECHKRFLIMQKIHNVNIARCEVLSSPEQVLSEIPLTSELAAQVAFGREAIMGILDRRDPRLLLIVGPCSIHNMEAGEEYARRLKRLSDSVSDRMVLVMRAYFEKPRTILGWKGMIYDPHLNGSNDVEAGVRQARRMLRDIVGIGLPVATEILEPIIPQYIADLVSWAAIGARTAESQPHRQMASGLSMPIGFKNSTDGSLTVAIEAIRAANAPHPFIGIDGQGHVAVFHTTGNHYGHLVLRGGKNGPNYSSEYIAFAREVMRKNHVIPNIVVDCSHANSGKDPKRQPQVLMDVIHQRLNGEPDIVGAMIESNLIGGRQDVVSERLADLIPGQSITDGCLGWEETEVLVQKAYVAMEPLFS